MLDWFHIYMCILCTYISIYLFFDPPLLEGPFVWSKATTKTAGHGTSKGPALILVKRFRLEPVLDERSKLCTLPWLENQLANETNRKCYVTLNDLKKSIEILSWINGACVVPSMYFETLNSLSSNITQSVNAPRKTTHLRIMQKSTGSKLQDQKDVYYIYIDIDIDIDTLNNLMEEDIPPIGLDWIGNSKKFSAQIQGTVDQHGSQDEIHPCQCVQKSASKFKTIEMMCDKWVVFPQRCKYTTWWRFQPKFMNDQTMVRIIGMTKACGLQFYNRQLSHSQTT